MGSFFSKRKKYGLPSHAEFDQRLNELEALNKKIIDDRHTIRIWHQNYSRAIIIYGVSLWVLIAAVLYIYYSNSESLPLAKGPKKLFRQILFLAPVIFFPFLLLALKRIIDFFANRNINYLDRQLENLENKRKEMLSEIDQAINFTKFQEIVDKLKNKPPSSVTNKNMNNNLNNPNRNNNRLVNTADPTKNLNNNNYQAHTGPVNPGNTGPSKSNILPNQFPESGNNDGLGKPLSDKPIVNSSNNINKANTESVVNDNFSTPKFPRQNPNQINSINSSQVNNLKTPSSSSSSSIGGGVAAPVNYNPPNFFIPNGVVSVTPLQARKQLNAHIHPLSFTPSSQPRNTLDKLVDFVLCDGPNNRYALICKECATHNGLVKEEDVNVIYRCASCGTINNNNNHNHGSGLKGNPGPAGSQPANNTAVPVTPSSSSSVLSNQSLSLNHPIGNVSLPPHEEQEHELENDKENEKQDSGLNQTQSSPSNAANHESDGSHAESNQ